MSDDNSKHGKGEPDHDSDDGGRRTPAGQAGERVPGDRSVLRGVAEGAC